MHPTLKSFDETVKSALYAHAHCTGAAGAWLQPCGVGHSMHAPHTLPPPASARLATSGEGKAQAREGRAPFPNPSGPMALADGPFP